jgi:hypothetical protein
MILFADKEIQTQTTQLAQGHTVGRARLRIDRTKAG